MVKIVPMGERYTLFNDNKLVGYVEDGTLYGLDAQGYAVEICAIDHQSEISTAFDKWKNEQHRQPTT